MRQLITLMIFVFVPALSFADCNMTGDCPGAPMSHYSVDAHGPTLNAVETFGEIAKALASNGLGIGSAGSEATVVPNRQATESLTRKNSKGQRVAPGMEDEGDGDNIK